MGYKRATSKMKKALLVIYFISFSLLACADDVIALRNGDIINAVVSDITNTEIKYKKASNPKGPTYTIDKSEVLSIKYANGEIDKFEATKGNTSEATTNGPTKALPNDQNEEQKAQYASLPRLNLKKSNKKSKYFFPIMAFTDSSVISTKELTIVIIPQAPVYWAGGYADGRWETKIGYTIGIANATDKPLYIDRAKSFRRNNSMETQSYFDNKQISVTHGNGSGVGVGGLGIGVGGSSSTSHTENYGVERFLVLGPHSTANLIDFELIRVGKVEYKIVSDIEYWGFDFINSDDKLNEGEVRTYTESSSPYSNTYYITYATDPEFKNSYELTFELYAKYVVGAKMKSPVTTNQVWPEKSLVKEIKKVVPDFWTDCLNIVGLPGEYK